MASFLSSSLQRPKRVNGSIPLGTTQHSSSFLWGLQLVCGAVIMRCLNLWGRFHSRDFFFCSSSCFITSLRWRILAVCGRCRKILKKDLKQIGSAVFWLKCPFSSGANFTRFTSASLHSLVSHSGCSGHLLWARTWRGWWFWRMLGRKSEASKNNYMI